MNELYQQAANAQVAVKTHLAARQIPQAKEAAKRLLAVLEQIEEVEHTQHGIGSGSKFRSHAPQIKQSAAKACLDKGVRQMSDEICPAGEPRDRCTQWACDWCQQGAPFPSAEPKRSMIAEAEAAPFMPKTLSGESYNTGDRQIDI